jgi:hypothetical protein
MDNQKVQVVERLKQANNILVTVSSNPSVDQLAACIGLTLALNKAGKHATAVFSGNVPSTIEFLQPEKTLEKNTDSLQDFIIALDKSKADKLRYKVEDKVVKIFITPYRTSISQKDLEFSQGDFNVDVVLALGVHMQSDLDQAITSHGRILHDATVMSVNVAPGGELGSVNWVEASASSLSELAVQVVNSLDQKLIDGQIATAFLTGIVAETDRFSNQRTSPQTMSISAQLMSSGANQQLVATTLEEPVAPPPPPVFSADATPSAQKKESGNAPLSLPPIPPKPKEDGTIEIAHNDQMPTNHPAPVEEPEEPAPEVAPPQIHIDDQGRLHPFENPINALPPIPPAPPIIKRDREDSSHMMTERPTFETPPLTANAVPEDEDAPTDPLGLPQVGLLNREPLPSQHAFPPAFDTPGATFAPSPSPVRNDAVVSPPPAPMSTPSALDIPGPAPTTSPISSPAPTSVGAPWNPPVQTFTPSTSAPAFEPPTQEGTKTLSQIEQDVNSPHLSSAMATSAPKEQGFITPSSSIIAPIPPESTSAPASEETSVDDARSAVAQAINDSPAAGEQLGPIQALNAQPLSDSLHANDTNTLTNLEPAIVQPQQTIPQGQQLAPPVAPPFSPLPGQTPITTPVSGMPPNVPPPMMPAAPTFPMNS